MQGICQTRWLLSNEEDATITDQWQTLQYAPSLSDKHFNVHPLFQTALEARNHAVQLEKLVT